MMDVLQVVLLALFAAAVFACEAAVVWSLVDTLGQRGATDSNWIAWAVSLLVFNVLAAIVYVRWGPGETRWPFS